MGLFQQKLCSHRRGKYTPEEGGETDAITPLLVQTADQCAVMSEAFQQLGSDLGSVTTKVAFVHFGNSKGSLFGQQPKVFCRYHPVSAIHSSVALD